MRVWLLLLLLVPAAAAGPGPDVAVLVHHPYPDDADPLGFPLDGGRDAFVTRHARFDADGNGFDFPSVVVDGVRLVEGLPVPLEGEDALAATTRAYRDAVEARLGASTPITLRVQAVSLDGFLRVVADVETTTSLDADTLRGYIAVVEDAVHYRPPPALSNGVFVHPFTVRNLTDMGPVTGPRELRLQQPMGDWDPQNLWIAVWVEQVASHGSRFDPGEVVQAAFHRLGDEATERSQRAVLLEAYSATWCDPCLLGDRALEEVALEYGVAREHVAADDSVYVAPPLWVWPFVALAFAAAAFVRLPTRYR